MPKWPHITYKFLLGIKLSLLATAQPHKKQFRWKGKMFIFTNEYLQLCSCFFVLSFWSHYLELLNSWDYNHIERKENYWKRELGKRTCTKTTTNDKENVWGTIKSFQWYDWGVSPSSVTWRERVCALLWGIWGEKNSRIVSGVERELFNFWTLVNFDLWTLLCILLPSKTLSLVPKEKTSVVVQPRGKYKKFVALPNMVRRWRAVIVVVICFFAKSSFLISRQISCTIVSLCSALVFISRILDMSSCFRKRTEDLYVHN